MKANGVIQSIDVSQSWDAASVDLVNHSFGYSTWLENGVLIPSKDEKQIMYYGGGVTANEFPALPPDSSKPFTPIFDTGSGITRNVSLPVDSQTSKPLVRSDGGSMALVGGTAYILGGSHGARDDLSQFIAAVPNASYYNATTGISNYISGMVTLDLDFGSTDSEVVATNHTGAMANFDQNGWGSIVNAGVVGIDSIGKSGILVAVMGMHGSPWTDIVG